MRFSPLTSLLKFPIQKEGKRSGEWKANLYVYLWPEKMVFFNSNSDIFDSVNGPQVVAYNAFTLTY
jgi:hypothetical protein